jgi:hypothetical protein
MLAHVVAYGSILGGAANFQKLAVSLGIGLAIFAVAKHILADKSRAAVVTIVLVVSMLIISDPGGRGAMKDFGVAFVNFFRGL